MLKIWSLLLLSTLLAVKAAPSGEDFDSGTTEDITEIPELTTPLPPVNVSNKTLVEQTVAVQTCWKDAGADHGPHSADPWVLGEDPRARKTDAEECAKITTYFDYCNCFISVIRAHGKTLIMRYFVYVGGFESEVTYMLSKENGL